VDLIFSRRITLENMGQERIIRPLAGAYRQKRMRVTVLKLSLDAARMLQLALNETLDNAGIIKVPAPEQNS